MTKIYLLIFWLGVSNLATAQNNRYYVNHQAAGANTGLSWPDAFTDLQQALQIAQAGDEVWVAEGAYRPTTGADRNVSFEPKSGVQLYGGFAGSETGLDARNWAAHPTVLSGDIGVVGDSTDNSYNVMYLPSRTAVPSWTALSCATVWPMRSAAGHSTGSNAAADYILWEKTGRPIP